MSQTIEIKHRHTGAVLYSGDCANLREAVFAAVKAGANLADANLAGANLAGADLADANLAGANLAGADLVRAYLAGANLAGADLAGAYLAGANLARADLAGADLAGANLARADLAGADLAGAYLAGANLARANLADANLADANLAGANLADADLGDVPVVPSLHRRMLAALDAGGELEMKDWHMCETSHCRAGWAIHLAGAKGHELERKVGPHTAGLWITLKSSPQAGMPNFYADNAAALADIKRCAELEPPIEVRP